MNLPCGVLAQGSIRGASAATYAEGATLMADKIILAYSGGLDTSGAIRWLKDTYGLDAVTLTVDVGNERDIPAVAERALRIGAVKALTVDARRDFLAYFVWPALQAGALYEGAYPLATAIARPLIAKLLVDTARQEPPAPFSPA